MVATIRTWIFDSNYAVVGATFALQVRDSYFRVHQLIRGTVGLNAAGGASALGAWTVVSSSNGLGVFGAGDNVLSSANCITAAAGVNHTWIVYSIAGLIPTRTLFFCIDLIDAAAPLSTANIVIFPSAPSAGSATARPTHVDEQTVPAPVDFFPNTTFTPRTVQGWRTSIGEIMFGFVRNGSGNPESGLWCPRFDGGEAATIWPFNLFSYQVGAASGGAFNYNNALLQSAQWLGFWQDDTPNVGGHRFRDLLDDTALLPAGVSNISGGILDVPCTFMWDSNTQGGYPGQIVDVRGCPTNTIAAQFQTGDADLVRRVTWGGLWVPWRAAAGAMIV